MTGNGLFPRPSAPEGDAQNLAKTLYKIPALVRHGTRCGKDNCRCQREAPHGPYSFLIWRDEAGRQRRCYVRQSDVTAVEQIITQRRVSAQATRRHVAEASTELRSLRRWLRELERSGAG
jgi:hypothetical protein